MVRGLHGWRLKVKRLNDTALLNKSSQSATRRHLAYGITQCYLPPDKSELARLTPTRLAGTRFTYPAGMEGWVDLGNMVYRSFQVTRGRCLLLYDNLNRFCLTRCWSNYTVFQKNGHPFCFCDYSVCCLPIFKIFRNIVVKEICNKTRISNFIFMNGI